MNIRYVIPAAAVLAATLAGCATGPAPETSTAPSASSVAMVPVLPDLHTLSKEVDTTAAQAALDAGAPFAFSIPDGPEAACHSAVVDPDGKVWILNESGSAPVAGVALTSKFKEYGCTGVAMPEAPGGVSAPAPTPVSTAPRPEGVPDLSWLSSRVDLTAAGEAMRTEKPFLFGAPDNGVAACHTALLLPGGEVWVMNKVGAAPAAGVALDRMTKTYGCRASGVPNEGGN